MDKNDWYRGQAGRAGWAIWWHGSLHEVCNWARSWIIQWGEDLLSVAYKNVVGARRSSWRVVSVLSKKRRKVLRKNSRWLENTEENRDRAKEYLQWCTVSFGKVLDPKRFTSREQSLLFENERRLLSCYLAEVAAGDDKKGIVDQSQQAYQEAFEISKRKCNQRIYPDWVWPLTSLCSIMTFWTPLKACSLAKTAFDEAIAELDT